MAHAKRIATPIYELTLTEDEAQTLRDILYKIGGDARTSRRRHIEPITEALEDVGIHVTSLFADADGGIYFQEQPF
jgi:hypothetical protein